MYTRHKENMTTTYNNPPPIIITIIQIITIFSEFNLTNNLQVRIIIGILN